MSDVNERDWGPGNPTWEDLRFESERYGGPTVVSTVDHQESLRRVRNLALWFALGGTVPTESIWD